MDKYQRWMSRYDALRNFNGQHPAVMRERVARFAPLKRRRNRWLNARFYRECLRHGIKL